MKQSAGVRATLDAVGHCARRSEGNDQIPALFSDDFFRRGIVTPGSGEPVTWSIQPDEEQLQSLDVFVLEDGRIAASAVNEWGAGAFLVFVEEDGSLLIDEAYPVTPEYPISP